MNRPQEETFIIGPKSTGKGGKGTAAHGVEATTGIVCLAVSKRMFPGASLQEVGELYRNQSDVKSDFDRARLAIMEEMNSSSILPTFMPSAEAEKIQMYGHCVYQKAALVTSDDVVSHTGKSPAQLKLQEFSPATQLH